MVGAANVAVAWSKFHALQIKGASRGLSVADRRHTVARQFKLKDKPD